MMQTMTYDEMKQLNGGKFACVASTIGWATAEFGMISGFATGGIGFGIAVVGMAAGLYGMMASC
jgi:hypothetical protein